MLDGEANEHSQDPRICLLIILDSSHDPYAYICTIFMVLSHDKFTPHVFILFSFCLLLYATPYVSFMRYVLSYVIMTRHVLCLYFCTCLCLAMLKSMTMLMHMLCYDHVSRSLIMYTIFLVSVPLIFDPI